MKGRFVLVVGHPSELHREEGALETLLDLGADARPLGLFEDTAEVFDDARDGLASAVVIEALDRLDVAVPALRALRGDARLSDVGALLAITEPHLARIDHGSGFDDFVLSPYLPSELYARIRRIEWRRSEFSNDERVKLGELVVDRSSREVRVGGRLVPLTAKEYALLVCLCEHRGKVKSREQLLARVWGSRYEGGARTVDIHVRRLRAKLGAALPLVTLRGEGYKIAMPEGA